MPDVAVGDIGKRVREARETMPGKMRIADLAQALGVSHGRLSNWERGKHDPPFEILNKVADLTGVTVEWLVGEPVPMRPPNPSNRPVFREGVRWVPIYGAISAGNPSCSQSDALEWYAMMDWGNEFERWGRVVDGFSMEPDLLPGMFAIFENRRAEVGHIVHAFDHGEDTVKQYRLRDDRTPVLVPTNPDYDTIEAKAWNIKGVCVAVVYKDTDGANVLREYPFGMRPREPRKHF